MVWYNMLMVISMKGIGKQDKDVGKEFISILMATFMMVNGAMIWKMGKENLRWQLEINTKVDGDKEKRMVLVCIFLLTAMFTRVNFQMEIDKEKAAILGPTRVIIKASGWLIKWTEKEFMLIQKFNLRDSSKMTTLLNLWLDFFNYSEFLFILNKAMWYFYLFWSCSVWEVEEMIWGRIILSHSIATNSISDKEWSPKYSHSSSIKVVNPPSLDNIFLESSVHVMKSKVLVSIWSRVDNITLNYWILTLS